MNDTATTKSVDKTPQALTADPNYGWDPSLTVEGVSHPNSTRGGTTVLTVSVDGNLAGYVCGRADSSRSNSPRSYGYTTVEGDWNRGKVNYHSSRRAWAVADLVFRHQQRDKA